MYQIRKDDYALKFLVAYAEDATFIAFRQPANAECYSGHASFGSYASGSGSTEQLLREILRLSEQFTGSDLKLFVELFRSGKLSEPEKRIIFCGHEMGALWRTWWCFASGRNIKTKLIW